MKRTTIASFVLGVVVRCALCITCSVADADVPVEPYASQTTEVETQFITQWREFLLHRGEADSGRYTPDVPFSFKCGPRSSREWVTLDKATIASDDWQNDGSRKHVLSWNDDVSSLRCEMEAKRCKKYFLGDYYPLANQQRNPAAWTAYHLFLPSEQAGMIVALRREKSDTRAMTFDLLTVDPTRQWEFEDYDSGETWTVSGQDIRQRGFEIVIPNRRDSRLIFYQAAGRGEN